MKHFTIRKSNQPGSYDEEVQDDKASGGTETAF